MLTFKCKDCLQFYRYKVPKKLCVLSASFSIVLSCFKNYSFMPKEVIYDIYFLSKVPTSPFPYKLD